MVKIEHRAVIKFLTKQGKSQKTIHEEMVAVYQGSAPSLSTVQKWSSEFKRGRESIEDDPRSGAPATACTGESIKEVEKLVLEDARIKVKMMAEITKLSIGTIHTILHDHLNLSKVSARWVPRMLTAPQKKVRIACCRELLEMCSENADGVMDRIVTGDETWVHHYDPESKQESMQWHKKGTDPPKKFKVTPSAGKLMATVFWDSKGILLIEYKKKVKPSTPHPTLPLCIICGRKLKRKDGVNSQRVCCFFMTTLLFTRREFPRLLREIVVSKKSNTHPIVQTLPLVIISCFRI